MRPPGTDDRTMATLPGPTGTPRALRAGVALLLLLAAAGAPAGAGADDRTVCDPSVATCRTMVLENNCVDEVWVGVLGNSVQCQSDDDCPSTSTCDTAKSVCTCTQDADCAPTVCDTNASPKQCRFPAPLGGGVALASGASETTYVPHVPPAKSIISWGGRFWARTGCPDFATCGAIGALCEEDSECCTNAGCNGAFTCQSANDCNTWPCTGDGDCPGGSTCNLTTSTCEGCVSGTCACKADTDCREGGVCQANGLCSGQCGPGGIACETGDCGGVLGCPVGVAGDAPATLAELTLQRGKANFDFYDVSMVDGFNVPVQITPSASARKNPKSGASGVTLWCGRPGCADASTCAKQANASCPSFASCLCDWSIDESTCPNAMRAVAPVACTSDADCSPGTCDTSTVPHVCTCKSDAHCPASAPTCGVNANIQLKKKRVCGHYVGCASPEQACAADKRMRVHDPGVGPFKCVRFRDLYGCMGAHAGSCYTTGADETCCGCPAWSPGGNAGPFPEAGSCQSSNTKWTRRVEPFVDTFKSACPTAYSFQYDDPTSTYNCSGKAGTPVGYTVTFCPAGSPGARPAPPPPCGTAAGSLATTAGC